MSLSRYIYARPPHHRWINSITFVLLGAMVAFGLLGLFGGYDRHDRIERPVATLSVDGPSIIRNGEYAEMVIAMTANSDLANATLQVDADFWREMTFNTMIPAPEKEEYRDGVMRFEFGPLAAGETTQFKIDAQVNPHRFGPSEGDFMLLDGDRELARLHRKLTVIP